MLQHRKYVYKGYKMRLDNEPTLSQIDDYNGNESPEKRKLVRNIIIGLLVVGAIYAMIRYSFDTPSDYIGTPQNPGITIDRQ
jgi:hypothetical protein